jgi:uncharacterized membrane protein
MDCIHETRILLARNDRNTHPLNNRELHQHSRKEAREQGNIQQQHEQTFYGWLYRIPESSPVTVIAINIGGAIIPFLISLYLFPYGLSLAGPTFIIYSTTGILIVTLITNRVAHLVPGLGIATPFFIPPAAALLCGLVLGGGFGTLAAIIAYMSGTLGTSSEPTYSTCPGFENSEPLS